MTWLAEQSRSLNMQQAVLECSQLENSIPAPASCFPSRHSLDPQRARRSRAQEQAHPHRQRGGGRKAESRLSQQIALSTSLPPRAVAPQQQGQMYWNKDGTGLPASQPGQGQEEQGHAPCRGCSRTHRAGPAFWSSRFYTEEQQCLTYFAAEVSNI